MKVHFLIVVNFVLLAAVSNVSAQSKFFTKSGRIDFDCSGEMERIVASNNSSTCVLDTHSGEIRFLVLLKGFEFEKALMQEHFNENYVESDKYPQSEFRGVIINNNDLDYSRDGEYHVKVKGELTLHGVNNALETEGILSIRQGKIGLQSGFSLLLSDYHIKIPGLVSDKIANTVKLKVNCMLQPLKG